MADIQLDYVVPAADIADFVTLFYAFRTELTVFEDTERADHAQVRFRLDPGSGDYRFADGTVQRSTPIHVIGPSSAAFHISTRGPVRLFGWGLTAAGWAAMLGGDASNALNTMMDGVPLFGPRALRVHADIAAASDPDTQAVIATAFIREMVRDSCREMMRFARTVDAWLEDSVSPSIDDLMTATGLSRRQIERKCNAMYGAPPKLLSRKFRALRAAVAMRGGEMRFDDVVGYGFYDQSHLIREVKQFTGLTPKQIRDQPTLLTGVTVAKRAEVAGQVKPLISDT